jgi:hypothetical protein
MFREKNTYYSTNVNDSPSYVQLVFKSFVLSHNASLEPYLKDF